MTKQIWYHLKHKFILNPFFLVLFVLLAFFNLVFPIIVLDILNFKATYLFDFQMFSLFYLISYCWIGVLWAIGTIYYFIFSTYKFGYIHGLLEVKYTKKQILLILLSLVLISSLAYILQVSIQTLILGLIYQDQGFEPWYALGAVFYSILLFAIIYSSIAILKLLFNLSNFVMGIIIICFTTIMPIMSSVLLSQTQAITIASFRENQNELINDGDSRDLILVNESGEKYLKSFEKNIYQNLIYLDLANQLKSALDIFDSQNTYKKIQLKNLTKQDEFNYFLRNGSYGVQADFEGVKNYKYLVDQEFLKAYNQENLLEKSHSSNDQINNIYQIFNALKSSSISFEIYYQDNKYTPSWSAVLSSQSWIYHNILNFIIFNLSNDIFDFPQDFMTTKKIVLEINENGYNNFVSQGAEESFWTSQNLEPYTYRIDIIDQDLVFNYLKKDYIYQMNSTLDSNFYTNNFEKQIWNLMYNPYLNSDSPNRDNYLNFQDQGTINQYFNFLNTLFYSQQKILHEKITSIDNLDQLTEYDNLLVTNIKGNTSAIAGIKQYNFEDRFMQITYQNLYPLYPFIIFWLVVILILLTSSTYLIKKQNLL